MGGGKRLEETDGKAEEAAGFVYDHGAVLGFGGAGCGVSPLDVVSLASVKV